MTIDQIRADLRHWALQEHFPICPIPGDAWREVWISRRHGEWLIDLDNNAQRMFVLFVAESL